MSDTPISNLIPDDFFNTLKLPPSFSSNAPLFYSPVTPERWEDFPIIRRPVLSDPEPEPETITLETTGVTFDIDFSQYLEATEEANAALDALGCTGRMARERAERVRDAIVRIDWGNGDETTILYGNLPAPKKRILSFRGHRKLKL